MTPQTSPDDVPAQLIARVALGDRAAFEKLYRLTSSHLLGVVLRIQRDRTVAEEVLQDVYVNIWRSAASFNPLLSQAKTWMSSVARNRAIDSLRRLQSEPGTVSRYQEDGSGEVRDLLEDVASPQPGPLEWLTQASQARALDGCMQQLSADQKQSLALTYYRGLSHAEVAQHTGQPLGSVKSWVRRGLQSLKSCLERASLGAV